MINFLKYQVLYFLISFIVIGVGLYSIISWGFRFSIEFVGGSNLEYLLDKKLEKNKIENFLKSEKIDFIELRVNGKKFSLKTKPLDNNQEKLLRDNLEEKFKIKVNTLKFETVGPVLGKETINKTIIASILAIIGILLYMVYAFKGFNYALAAILAMIHDFLVLLGSYSIISHFFKAEFDLMFVTAILTTMSFSVHDTIVIFDKIREYLKVEGKKNIMYFANKALTETMVRSLNNSMTIIFMLLALFLMGGEIIRYFIFALLIGTITATYSSPFVATPILVWLEKRRLNKLET